VRTKRVDTGSSRLIAQTSHHALVHTLAVRTIVNEHHPIPRTRLSAGRHALALRGLRLVLHVRPQFRHRQPGLHESFASAAQALARSGRQQGDGRGTATFSDGRLLPADCGCGEPGRTGRSARYYLRQLAAAVPDDQALALLGLDISKWAVLAAAKQDKRPSWVVGSNAKLPVLPGTLDRVLCMFGFPVYAEFARVLKPGGLLVQVDAGPDHLRELREIIYPSLKPERPAEMPTPEGFRRLPTETVRFSIDLTSAEQIADLLAMTPHLYRAKAEGRAKAGALTALSLGIDVRLTCFERGIG